MQLCVDSLVIEALVEGLTLSLSVTEVDWLINGDIFAVRIRSVTLFVFKLGNI